MGKNFSMDGCLVLSWMVVEEDHHWTPNCRLNDHSNHPLSYWHHHQDPHHSYIFFFSWCWKEEEDEKEKYAALVSWFKNLASDMYQKTQGAMKENINKCIVNELTHCVNETKRWYVKKLCRDVSFILSPILGSWFVPSPLHPTTYMDRDSHLILAGVELALALLIGFLWRISVPQ